MTDMVNRSEVKRKGKADLLLEKLRRGDSISSKDQIWLAEKVVDQEDSRWRRFDRDG